MNVDRSADVLRQTRSCNVLMEDCINKSSAHHAYGKWLVLRRDTESGRVVDTQRTSVEIGPTDAISAGCHVSR